MDYVIVNVRLAGDAFTYKNPFDSVLLESHQKKFSGSEKSRTAKA
jgi:hypothetical protein